MMHEGLKPECVTKGEKKSETKKQFHVEKILIQLAKGIYSLMIAIVVAYYGHFGLLHYQK
jgi:hypothetical protein